MAPGALRRDGRLRDPLGAGGPAGRRRALRGARSAVLGRSALRVRMGMRVLMGRAVLRGPGVPARLGTIRRRARYGRLPVGRGRAACGAPCGGGPWGGEPYAHPPVPCPPAPCAEPWGGGSGAPTACCIRCHSVSYV